MIEDDPDFARLLIALFSRERDLKVLGAASTISTGLRWIERAQPAVVLSDFHLGDGTGDVAVPVIRRLAPSTAIVLMSADLSGEAAGAAGRVGADAYLDKAVPLRRFAEVVRSVVRSE